MYTHTCTHVCVLACTMPECLRACMRACTNKSVYVCKPIYVTTRRRCAIQTMQYPLTQLAMHQTKTTYADRIPMICVVAASQSQSSVVCAAVIPPLLCSGHPTAFVQRSTHRFRAAVIRTAFAPVFIPKVFCAVLMKVSTSCFAQGVFCDQPSKCSSRVLATFVRHG